MNETVTKEKLKVATAALCGCFGCHMSLLDIDERLADLLEVVEFNRTPITDIKECAESDIGLIEGGVCNVENVHVLREFRKKCKILVAVGACALNGGLPAMRNHLPLQQCLEAVYLDGSGVTNPQIPNDPELPLLLEQVHPIHEIVNIDYSLPGCPPSAEVFWKFLTDLIAGREPSLPTEMIHYD